MNAVAKFHKGGPPRLYTARFRPELIHFRPATGFRPASGGEVWRTLRASGPRPKLGAKRAYTRARLPTSSLRLLGGAGVRTSDTRNPARHFATAFMAGGPHAAREYGMAGAVR